MGKRSRDEADSDEGQKKKKSSRKDEKVEKKKKHKKEKEEEKASSKHHRKDSEKKSKSSSSHKKKHKHDKEKEEPKSQREVPEGDQLTESDYFRKATEFRVWLRLVRKKYFEDLTSEEAHRLFCDRFVKDWNRGSLDEQYYTGQFPEEVVNSAKKTQHKWGFMSKLSAKDKADLAQLNDSVQSVTEKAVAPPSASAGKPAGASGGGRGGSGGGAFVSSRPTIAPRHDDVDEAEDRRKERERARKRDRMAHGAILDDVAPKETGRQAIIDKRKTAGDRFKGAAREREEGRDGLDMSERDTMGGGDDFKAALARQQKAQARKQDAKTSKLNELQNKEDAKREAFLLQMGLKPGQKIEIKPRT